MRKLKGIFLVCSIVSIFFNVMMAGANDALPITAEQAFDAYAFQADPLTGNPENVAIVDIRSVAEYNWVGTCAKVDKIIKKNGHEIIPFNGKVILSGGNGFLRFKIWNYGFLVPCFVHVSQVEEIETSPIAINIPFRIWDDENCQMLSNANFVDDLEALADQGISVIILTCRSGGRTTIAEFDDSLFSAIYEIDQPDGTNNRGGFEGSAYGDVYNGYRGFPGRKTFFQEAESVSWKDAGLPIHIGWCPPE